MKTNAENSSRVNTVPCMATNRQRILEMALLLVKRKNLACLYPAVQEAFRHWLLTRSVLNLNPAQSRPFRCLHESWPPLCPIVALVPRRQRRTLLVSVWPRLYTRRQERLDHRPTVRHRFCKEPHKRLPVLRQSVLVLLTLRTQPPSGPSHLAHASHLRHPTRHRQAMRQASDPGERIAACGET